MVTPQIECIFCDDIRMEDNGKSILIGCYGPDMYVPSFPARFPTFSAAIRIRIPKSFKVEGNVKCGIQADGEYLSSIPPAEIDVSDVDFDRSDVRLGDSSELVLSIALIANGFGIEKASVLQAVAEINGANYGALKLRVNTRPAPDSTHLHPVA